MDIIKQARILGKAIQEDPRYIEYAKAKLAVDGDKNLQDLIGEFNLTKFNLDELEMKEEKDEKAIRELNEKLRGIYNQVMAQETMTAFTSAKAGVDKILNDINQIIMMCAEGEDPDKCEIHEHNCSGDCGCCSGCH